MFGEFGQIRFSFNLGAPRFHINTSVCTGVVSPSIRALFDLDLISIKSVFLLYVLDVNRAVHQHILDRLEFLLTFFLVVLEPDALNFL